MKKWHIFLFLSMFIVIWLPRGLALDRFVTPDEPKWLARSGNFYLALAKGDLERTFTRQHPGVTVTWIGTAAYMLRFPAYIDQTPGYLTDSRQIEEILRSNNLRPMEILETARILMVILITVILSICFVYATYLLGWIPATMAFVMVSFDPFHIAHSRLFHLDGLVSSLMLLSILAFLYFFRTGFHTRDLVCSAIAAGLAWLTKSPALFLIPFFGIILVIMLVNRWISQCSFQVIHLTQWSKPILLWCGIAGLVFFLLWPAMWVDPLGSLQKIFEEASIYATEGHSSEIFFNGMVFSGDPGRRFYILNYLWRITPVVLMGLILAVPSLLIWLRKPVKNNYWETVVVLALFGGLYTVFMTLGAKKFDRYLLPIFAPLDIIAGMGWFGLANWMGERLGSQTRRLAVPAVLVMVILGQALQALPAFPYYLSYYNPLMGGGNKAPQVMMIGWGEGLDQAARYLNTKPDAAQLRVMSWYPDGPFSYLFNGTTVHAASEWEETQDLLLDSDYIVTYIHQWQRRLPFPEMLDYLDNQIPEKRVFVSGIEYAQIFRVPDH